MLKKGSMLKALGLKSLQQSHQLERRSGRLQKRIARLSEFSRTIDELSRCWQDVDPGKFGPHWFWVRRFSLRPEKCWNLPKIGDCDKFWVTDMIGDKTAKVPQGNLDEAATRPCPNCKCAAGVVGCYRQTEDSPEGDTWQLDLFTLCDSCLKVMNFARRCEAVRFF